jgi:hypothetical protein
LSDIDLGRAGRAKFDVTPLIPTTYSKLQNAMQNAKSVANCNTLARGVLSKNPIFLGSKFFRVWHGKCIIYGIRKRELKMEMIQITKNTSAMVKNGKVIYLIQNGKITQDPLKVRYFQRMI